jgi:hypothetical protein
MRTGSAVRGAGVGLACLLPRLPGRARVVVASYAVGWPLGKPGLQLLVVAPDKDADAWKRATFPFASSGASWTALMLVAVSALRRSSVPAPVAAVVLGGAVAIGDSLLVGVGERAMAKAAQARAVRDGQKADPD